jgi:hypothetical protein
MAKTKPVRLTTNGIIEAYSKVRPRLKLTIKKLDRSTVSIEGSAKALEFLGRFIVAHSQADPDDCGKGLSPNGAGSAWFTKESTLGFYLHRLPCRGNLPVERRAVSLRRGASSGQDGN